MKDKTKAMVGKTLDDVLHELGDDNSILYIGSASSYFCIGTAKEVNSMIDTISDAYLKLFTNYYEKNKEEMEQFSKLIKQLSLANTDDLEACAEELATLSEKITTTSKATRKAMKRLETFKNMRERQIKDAYYKISDEGISIILTGVETGKYWTKDEWDAEMMKGVN